MKRALGIAFGVLLLCVALSGCTDTAALEERLSALETRISQIEKDLASVRLQVAANSPQKVGVLDPTATGYVRIDSNNGFFLVSVKEIQPYLDGYRLTLNIGNPLQARFDGLTLNVEWGKAMPTDGGKLSEWMARIRRRTFQVSDTLEPGTWTPITVVLPSTPPEEMRYLAISIETSAIALRVKQ